MTKKKKVLILCVDFPPWPSIGAQRPASWCLYADPGEFDITVVTRKWKDTVNEEADYFVNPSSFPDEAKFGHAKVFYTDFKPNLRDKIILSKKSNYVIKTIQKILTGFYYIVPYFFRFFDNNREIYYKAKEYLKNNPDTFMIIATGEPFITFRYAFLLSKKFSIPWCADYRDGWSSNYGVKYMPFTQRLLLTRILRTLEKRMVNNAKIVTTVAPALKSDLVAHIGRDVHVIFNGYFSEEIAMVKKTDVPLYDIFTIAYVGSFGPYQPLEEFATFIERLVQEDVLSPEKFKIIFYGSKSYEERIRHAFQEKSVQINIYGKIPRLELLKELKRCHVLLHLASDIIDGSAAKIYEYIALRKPIFVYKNDNGTIKYLLDYTKSGFLYTDYDSAKKYLAELFNAYLQGDTVKFKTEPINVEEFSREYQTKKFFELIKAHGRG